MNTTKWLAGCFLAGALGLAGCGPSDKSPQPMVINEVKVDILKLQQVFPSATPEQQSSLSKTSMAIRYGRYPDALAELNKLAGDASLAEPQKKVINEAIEQVKQLIAKTPAAPPP